MKRKEYEFIIGIDTGVNTGVAIWRPKYKDFIKIESVQIHKAIFDIKEWSMFHNILVRIEDARLRKWIPKGRGREVLQGVGSVKRDAKILEDLCKDLGIDYELVAPKKNRTKLTSDAFKSLTGWEKQTNEHSRDAGMLVFNYN